jgi:hypothetical protein
MMTIMPVKSISIAKRKSRTVSGNSKSGEYRGGWQPMLNRHGFERVCKFGSAVTAHFVALALQCEHAAEVHMVTAKDEIEDRYDGRHKHSFWAWSCSAERFDQLTNRFRRQLSDRQTSQLLQHQCLFRA